MGSAEISILGTLAGASLGLAGGAAISRGERRESRRIEMRQVYARFLAATYSAVAELRELPPGSEGTTISRILDQIRGEEASYVQTRKTLAEMGNTHIARMDRMNAAIAEIQVLDLPPELIAIVNDTGEYVQRLSDERTEPVKAEWPAYFDRLQTGAAILNRQQGWWSRFANYPGS